MHGLIQVPEGRKVFPNLSVHENLELGAFTRGRERRTQNLDKVYATFPRLKERVAQLAGTLSGGEQQMLAIGRGLMACQKKRDGFIAEGAETLHAIKLAEIARTNARLDTEGLSTWRIESEILHSKSESTGPIQEPGISRSEWDWAMAFMADNGISLRKDREESWRTFCKLRSHYYQPAYFLADTLFAVQAPWSGPRNMSAAKNFQTVWPMLAMQRREDTETSKGKINLPTV
jgi:hypothetical protein